MIDASTVDKEDLLPYRLEFPGRTGYNYGVKHNPKHRCDPAWVACSCDDLLIIHLSALPAAWESRRSRWAAAGVFAA